MDAMPKMRMANRPMFTCAHDEVHEGNILQPRLELRYLGKTASAHPGDDEEDEESPMVEHRKTPARECMPLIKTDFHVMPNPLMTYS